MVHSARYSLSSASRHSATLGHVFVANMTGNVVFLGFALAGAPGFSIAASLVAVAAFGFGALLGGLAGARYSAHRGHLFRLATALQALFLAAARKLAVPDLTTTVLTLTLTGIATDSKLAGGSGSKAGRRLTAVAAMLVGALIGAVLVRHAQNYFPLLIAFVIVTLAALAAHTLGRTDPAWVHPPA